MTLVHYMPWFSSEPVSGDWGWHWTMGHFDPGRLTDDGNREVAAHDYPLIGPYDSSDPDVLEYHVLLMKLAGIDGAIVDWYGIRDFEDYAVIHRNTEHLITYLRMAGLKFAVCYEDQTVRHMIEGGVLQPGADVPHGIEVMDWLQQNWFADDVYLQVDGRPVLLVFGPQHFTKAQWAEMTAGLVPPPRLYALPHLSREAGADGVFGWPPVFGGDEILPACMTVTDTSTTRGVRPSRKPSRGRGSAPSRMIQITTWNDHGIRLSVSRSGPTEENAGR